MAIFKSLFRKKAPASLAPRSGMQAEALNAEGARVFSGRLRMLDDDVLEIRSPEGAPFFPPPVYRQQVTVRFFSGSGESGSLDGTVLANGLRVWRIERWKPDPLPPNDRSTFRQSTGTEGRLQTPTGQMISCKVQNISAGGVQITASSLFQLKSTLLLEVVLLPDEPPFSLNCLVKRVQVRPVRGSFSKNFVYGCQFFEVPPREQERLQRTIFTLERGAGRYRDKRP